MHECACVSIRVRKGVRVRECEGEGACVSLERMVGCECVSVRV